jgi:hypothetical protein
MGEGEVVVESSLDGRFLHAGTEEKGNGVRRGIDHTVHRQRLTRAAQGLSPLVKQGFLFEPTLTSL